MSAKLSGPYFTIIINFIFIRYCDGLEKSNFVSGRTVDEGVYLRPKRPSYLYYCAHTRLCIIIIQY